MIELILAAAAAQATGIPAEVWIAIIGAISGSLIKPVFDLVSQRITVQKETTVAEKQAALDARQKLLDEIDSLKAKIRQIEDEGDDDIQSARKREDEWREKYYAVMERFNSLYSPPEQRVDLSDPGVLKEVIKRITSE